MRKVDAQVVGAKEPSKIVHVSSAHGVLPNPSFWLIEVPRGHTQVLEHKIPTPSDRFKFDDGDTSIAVCPFIGYLADALNRFLLGQEYTVGDSYIPGSTIIGFGGNHDCDMTREIISF